MATYSQYPIFVDGVRLDSSAWNISSKVRTFGAARPNDVTIPGVDGVVGSVNDDIDVMTITLQMWLLGTDENGLITGGQTAMDMARNNLDTLAMIFSKRHALINYVETVSSSGAQRQAFCKVTDTISPELRAGGSGKLTVTLRVLSGLLADPSTSDWSQTGIVSGSGYTVSSLTGLTGPVADAIVLFTGPVNNPSVTDSSGSYVRLNMSLVAGQQWRFNGATWASRVGVGLTLASLDTAGSIDAEPITVSGGGTARLLRLAPVLSGGARSVIVTPGGAAYTGATSLAIRAKRKYVQ